MKNKKSQLLKKYRIFLRDEYGNISEYKKKIKKETADEAFNYAVSTFGKRRIAYIAV